MQLTLQDAFALAARHESAGHRADAHGIYEQILVALPDHPGALLKIALQEIGEGRADAACERLGRALTVARQQALPTQEIWLALGCAHLACADRVKARDAAERAVDVAPESVDIMMKIGQLALDSGHPSLGERCFRAAREREPCHAAAGSGRSAGGVRPRACTTACCPGAAVRCTSTPRAGAGAADRPRRPAPPPPRRVSDAPAWQCLQGIRCRVPG